VKPGPGFVTTRKDNIIYLHIFESAPDELSLPALPRKIVSANILGGGAVEVAQADTKWTVSLPRTLRKPIDTIVKITLDGSAMDLKPVTPPREFGKASASNVFQKQSSYSADMAVDGDPSTRWATDTGTAKCWIEAELEKPGAIRGIEIDEAHGYEGRVEKFTVQVKVKGAWKEVAAGTKLGKFRMKLDPVEATAVRLDITAANEGPTISEIRIVR
jgi:alpha-L-fucosidase